MKYKQGSFVVFSLTGEIVMILEALSFEQRKSGINAYYVRFPNKQVVKVAEFELQDRNIE